ncbi:MAG: HD domain-containing protein [Solirubrobacterales bacterium]
MSAEPAAAAAAAEADRFAAAAHGDQIRNYTGRPYIEHPRAVAELVAGAGLGEEAVAAALLHDTVEDTATTLPELRERFGEPVGDLVGVLTEDPSIEPYEARKDAHREQVLRYGPPATAIYAADKLCNVRDLRRGYAAEGESVARRFKAPLGLRIALWERDLEGLRGLDPRPPFLGDLERELGALAEERARQRTPGVDPHPRGEVRPQGPRPRPG